MKRILSIFICLSLSVCLFACGDKDNEDVKSAVSDTVSNVKSDADNVMSDAKSDADDIISDAKSDAGEAVSDAKSYEESMISDFGSENIEDDDGIIDDDASVGE